MSPSDFPTTAVGSPLLVAAAAPTGISDIVAVIMLNSKAQRRRDAARATRKGMTKTERNLARRGERQRKAERDALLASASYFTGWADMLSWKSVAAISDPLLGLCINDDADEEMADVIEEEDSAAAAAPSVLTFGWYETLPRYRWRGKSGHSCLTDGPSRAPGTIEPHPNPSSHARCALTKPAPCWCACACDACVLRRTVPSRRGRYIARHGERSRWRSTRRHALPVIDQSAPDLHRTGSGQRSGQRSGRGGYTYSAT